MASTSETGHARNVANFEDLLTICTAFGPAYQPSNPHLQLTALRQQLEQARLLMSKVKNEGVIWSQTVGERQLVFAPLRTLSTRIVSAIGTSGAPTELLRKVQTAHRKIHGRRATALPVATTETEKAEQPVKKTVSVSQQSFRLLTDHFDELLTALANQPKYQPNEPELKLDALHQQLAAFQQCCTKAKQHEVNLQNARRDRDQLFYAENGLCDLAANVKIYVRSIFGASSPQYKQVSGLEFKLVPK